MRLNAEYQIWDFAQVLVVSILHRIKYIYRQSSETVPVTNNIVRVCRSDGMASNLHQRQIIQTLAKYTSRGNAAFDCDNGYYY